jgi:hypothetical protein
VFPLRIGVRRFSRASDSERLLDPPVRSGAFDPVAFARGNRDDSRNHFAAEVAQPQPDESS